MYIEKKRLIKFIKKNKDEFEILINKIKLETNFSRKIKLAYKGIKLANNASTTYYSSHIIENVFIELAQKNNIDLFEHTIKNSVLHVATEVYNSGGHTRVIERWIESAQSDEVHSVILTKNINKEGLEVLENAIQQKNGAMIKIPDDLSDIEKGLELRKIASRYEKIILHIHMNDVVPLIAFGTNEFKSPVFFFNHADHRFFLGVGISDCIVNFREYGKKISKELRGSKNNFILPLLQKEKMTIQNKNIDRLKKELNLPLDKKIIFTSGSDGKYQPLLKYNFNTYIEKILNNRKDVFFLAVGGYKNLSQTQKKFGKERVKLLKNIPFAKFFKYLSCADLVIDSFPMSGGVALLDAISQNKPILSMECPTGQSDFIEKSPAYCKHNDELLDKTTLMLDNEKECQNNISIIKKLFNKDNSKPVWQSKVNNLYSKYTSHNILEFTSKSNKKYTYLDIYLMQSTIKTKIKFRIPFVLTIYQVIVT